MAKKNKKSKISAQGLINKVYHHFITMKRAPAFNGYSCRYRIERGNKKVDRCAIGICIPKSMYDPLMENYSVDMLFRRTPVDSLFSCSAEEALKIQSAHDIAAIHSTSPEKFRNTLMCKLQRICKAWNLIFPGD